jgi:hypothetical protein
VARAWVRRPYRSLRSVIRRRLRETFLLASAPTTLCPEPTVGAPLVTAQQGADPVHVEVRGPWSAYVQRLRRPQAPTA